MNTFELAISAAAFSILLAMSQSQDPPLSDTRLTVHTLLREDIFAGFLGNDMTRFARGEKNIESLMIRRPEARADLLAWKAGSALYRAILANDSHRPEEFKLKYQQALDLFTEARNAQPPGTGVAAITGGSYVIFADRLPKEYRTSAWSKCYDSYQTLWAQQGSIISGLPIHHRGEVLGGLTKSALRTGHKQEAIQFADKMIDLLRGTSYEAGARRLKDEPGAVEKTRIACLSCHESGRLGARLTALDKK
jgi:hypothetical protein